MSNLEARLKKFGAQSMNEIPERELDNYHLVFVDYSVDLVKEGFNSRDLLRLLDAYIISRSKNRNEFNPNIFGFFYGTLATIVKEIKR